MTGAENWIPSPVDPAKVRARADLAEGNNFPFVLMGITELRELCDLALRCEAAERHLAALRDETLRSAQLRAMHESAKAYSDAVQALAEVRGGPLSTTIGYLIRHGYLVPSDQPRTPED